MRKRRFHTSLIIVLPMALIIISSLLILLRVSRAAFDDLPEIIKAIADERINGTVEIGSTDVSLSKGIILSDVLITGRVNNSPLIKIPRITLKANLINMVLRGANSSAEIKMIDIQEPSISISRKHNGLLDIYDLLKKTTGGQKVEFRERIQIRDASLTINDYTSTSASPEVNRFHNADAVVTFPDSVDVAFIAKGEGETNKVSALSCSGKYNLKTGTYTVNIGMKDAAAGYWSKYPYDSRLRINSGKADGRILLNLYRYKEPVDYHILADVRDVSISFNGIHKPIDAIRGKVDLRRDMVGLNVDAKFGVSPISASGYIINFRKPKLALRASIKRANFKEIANNVSFRDSLKFASLPDHGSISALIVGEPSSPGIEFHTEVPSATISGMAFSSIVMDGVYAEKRILLNNSSAKCYGGTTEFTGEINLSRNAIVKIRGKVNAIRLSDLPFTKGTGVAGTGSGPVQISWEKGDLDANYSLNIKNPLYRQYVFNDGHIRGSYSNGISHIESVETGIYGGKLSASGIVGKGNILDFSVYGTNMNLAKAGTQFWETPTAGRAQFAGKITGSLASPRFIGFIEGYNVVASEFTIERINADLMADRNSILINKMTLFDYPGNITISGNIRKPFDREPVIDLTVSADSINVDRFSHYAGIADLSGGLLSADLMVTGPLKRPDAEGRILLTDMLYHGIQIDAIGSGVSFRDQILDIGEFRLVSNKSQLTAKGTIAHDKSINISFNGASIPLDRLSAYLKPYVSLRGNIDLTGKVTGTLKSPIANLSVNGIEPVINGRKFTSIGGDISVDRSIAAVRNLELTETGSIYRISNLSYDIHEKNMTIEAGIEDGHGAMLLALLDSSPYTFQQLKPNIRFRELLRTIPRPFTAKIGASITGTAKFASAKIEPDLRFDSSITDLTYGSNSIKDIQMKGSWRNDIISLDEFEAIDGDTNISADASLGPKDSLSLRIDIHNLSTTAVKQIAKLPDNFSGKADVTIVANGSKYKPSAQMSLEIVDPVIAGIKFERLRAGFSSKGNESGLPDAERSGSVGLIDIDEITLVLNEHNFRTSGYIPVDWRDITLKNDSPILLEATLDPDTLSFLSALTGLSMGVRQDGKFEGSAKMAGTIKQPSFTGNLAWRKGFINVPRLNQPFEIDQADISLNGNKINIDSFTGHSAQGGSFTADGNAVIANMKPVLDMNLKANALRVSGRNISNTYGEDVDAVINGDLKISGAPLTPSIKGNLTIPTGQMSMPGKAVPQTPPKVLAFNPSFDVGISLGSDMRFKSSRLRIPLFGNINVKGPLKRISVDGRVDISDGTIMFPIRSMRLLNGSTMDLYVRPDQPSVVNLNITGQTRITAQSGLNQRRQYTITMIARGNLDNLNTVFSSSPPGLTNDQIVALLTGQRQIEQLFSNQAGDFGKELSGLFSAAVLPGVLGGIEQSFGSALGLEGFALDLGYNEPIHVTLTERLGDKITLSYSSFLGSRPDYADSQYDIKITYRIKNNFEVGVSVDDNRIYTLLVEGRVNF